MSTPMEMPIDRTNHELWEGIHYILSSARRSGLEAECIAHFIGDITSPGFDGNFLGAAWDALYEWDI